MPSYEAVLTALDQTMPLLHTPMWLVFEAKDTAAALKAAQKGLDLTVAQLPFLSGQIFEVPEDNWRVKLKWSDENPKVVFQEIKGEGLPTFAELAARGYDLEGFPVVFGHWRTDGDAKGPDSKTAIRAEYIILEGGILILLAPHHCLVDGGGRHMMYELWAANCREPDNAFNRIDPREPLHRADRLSNMIKSAVGLSKSNGQAGGAETNGTAAPQPAPSRQLPGDLLELDPLASRIATIFQLSVRQLEALRKEVRKHTKHDFSLNSLVSTLLWVAWIDALVRRLKAQKPDRDMSEFYSTLGMAVGGRRLFEKMGLLEKSTFLGNLVGVSEPKPRVAFEDAGKDSFDVQLPTPGGSQPGPIPCPQALPAAIDAITELLAATSASELATMWAGLETMTGSPDFDYRAAFRGAAIVGVNGVDIIVTNWAAFDFLLDYGSVLGRPKAARLMNHGGCPSGICIMLPRHRGGDDQELRDHFDISFAVQEEDLKEMEKNKLLQALARGSLTA